MLKPVCRKVLPNGDIYPELPNGSTYTRLACELCWGRLVLPKECDCTTEAHVFRAEQWWYKGDGWNKGDKAMCLQCCLSSDPPSTMEPPVTCLAKPNGSYVCCVLHRARVAQYHGEPLPLEPTPSRGRPPPVPNLARASSRTSSATSMPSSRNSSAHSVRPADPHVPGNSVRSADPYVPDNANLQAQITHIEMTIVGNLQAKLTSLIEIGRAHV